MSRSSDGIIFSSIMIWMLSSPKLNWCLIFDISSLCRWLVLDDWLDETVGHEILNRFNGYLDKGKLLLLISSKTPFDCPGCNMKHSCSVYSFSFVSPLVKKIIRDLYVKCEKCHGKITLASLNDDCSSHQSLNPNAIYFGSYHAIRLLYLLFLFVAVK